jgi:hypothetical protein
MPNLGITSALKTIISGVTRTTEVATSTVVHSLTAVEGLAIQMRSSELEMRKEKLLEAGESHHTLDKQLKELYPDKTWVNLQEQVTSL